MKSTNGSYPGGKANVFRTLLMQMPPHYTYIEPFLGAGGVFFRKKAARLNIGIDADAAVIDAAMDKMPSGHTWIREGDFFGLHGWQYSYGEDGGIRFLLLVGSALDYFRNSVSSPGTFVYADPPYLASTLSRPGRKHYDVEFGEGDHGDMLRLLRRDVGMVMVSGYWSGMYAKELVDWRSFSYEAMTRSGKTATEWCWCNYEEPAVLHDWAFLGADYRVRERIKKKEARWLVRLGNMEYQERLALLSAIYSRFGIDESRWRF